jgi:hypothetical protein
MELDGKGRKHVKMNPEWVVLMEVLRDLEKQPYANPVGRTRHNGSPISVRCPLFE